jgi:hypothetical protein
MKAEIMRAIVDVFNHVILFFANKWSRHDADEFHNYGYGGYKNLAVIAPGLAFFASGMYNTIFPMYATIYDVIPHDTLTITPLSLTAIVACNVGELVLFYLNLGDVTEDDGLSIPRKLFHRIQFSIDILLKKRSVDPIQDAIITENILAVCGVTIPLLSSGTIYFLGMEWLDMVGELMNGIL